MAGKWDFQKFMNAVAYWAMIIAAIALVIGQIFTKLRVFLLPIASFLAFAVASVSAFHYARSRRNVAWMIIFIVVAIVVLAMLFLAMVR